MNRTFRMLLVFGGVIAVGTFFFLTLTLNPVSSQTRHTVPLTPTLFPVSSSSDLDPQLSTQNKYKIYVRRADGTYYLLLANPSTPKSQLPLAAGDTIVQAVPPDSFFTNKVPPPLPPANATASQANPSRTRTPRAQPTGQPAYSPAGEDE